MAPNFADVVDNAGIRSDPYIAAGNVDLLVMDCPEFWKHGGDEKYLKGTTSNIGVVPYQTFNEALRVGKDAVNYYWKQMQRMPVKTADEKKYRQLEYREDFWFNMKPVFFVQPKLEQPAAIWGADPIFDLPLPEQILRAILKSFYHQLQDAVQPNWWMWGRHFDSLCFEDMFHILESLASIPAIKPVVEVKQRVCIIVGLDEAYSEETEEHIRHFLRFLDRYFVWNKSGKVLLFCKPGFDVRSLVSPNVFGKDPVVIYEGPDDIEELVVEEIEVERPVLGEQEIDELYEKFVAGESGVEKSDAENSGVEKVGAENSGKEDDDVPASEVEEVEGNGKLNEKLACLTM